MAGGLNGYRYTLNPTGWVDPLGLACQCPGDIEADGPFSEIVPGGGLAAHEARGGHLIEKHIGRTNAQLAQRLEAEPHIPAASTFPDRSTAEFSAARAIAANEQKIENFLAGPKEKTTIKNTFSQPVGVSLLNGRTDYLPASKVLLVLKKDQRSPTGYFFADRIPGSMNTEFPELHDFFGAYFHQDWSAEHESAEQVLEAFLAESDVEILKAVQQELSILLGKKRKK
nr:hypothetical protein GCM10020185_43500 [Pseudomonas brassicacearum subsp. brassicacearum]